MPMAWLLPVAYLTSSPFAPPPLGVCSNFITTIFYDTDRDDVTKPLRFALSLQALLMGDPINGDLKMQQAVQRVTFGSYNALPPGGPSYANESHYYPDLGFNASYTKVIDGLSSPSLPLTNARLKASFSFSFHFFAKP